MLKLIVFLGNPGTEHQQTRHNIGWMLAGTISVLRGTNWQKKFKGQYMQESIRGNKLIFLKPETFMNLSGQSVLAAMQFFKIEPEEILVVYDDLELDYGQISFKKGGGLGGHNGLRSIADVLGTRDFYRFRLGISRPSHSNISAYVLSKFSEEERMLLPDFLEKAVDILENILVNDLEITQKKYAKTKLIA